jgi:hypothetical protein
VFNGKMRQDLERPRPVRGSEGQPLHAIIE